MRNSGQCVTGANCTAVESNPSIRVPLFHRTKPPYMLRQALPEPCRAIDDTSSATW